MHLQLLVSNHYKASSSIIMLIIIIMSVKMMIKIDYSQAFNQLVSNLDIFFFQSLNLNFEYHSLFSFFFSNIYRKQLFFFSDFVKGLTHEFDSRLFDFKLETWTVKKKYMQEKLFISCLFLFYSQIVYGLSAKRN